MGGWNGCLHTGLLVPGDNSLLNGLEKILLNRQDESLVFFLFLQMFPFGECSYQVQHVILPYNLTTYTYSNLLGL